MFNWIKGVALALSLLTCAAGTWAQSAYPTKPVWIVTGGAGSGPDILARILAQKLGEEWKQQVLVDNRAGAMGKVGARLVATSPADGYMLFLGTAAYPISAHIYKNMGFDPLQDLVGASRIAQVPLLLAGNSAIGGGNLSAVLARLKAEGKPIDYATPGAGSLQHLVTEQFARVTGLPMQHIPYKSGAEAVRSLLGGETRLSFVGLTPAIPHITSGKLVPLAVSTGQRYPGLQDVPTLAEAGFPQLEADNWHAVLVAKATPAPVLAEINRAINKALQSPDVIKRFADAGAVAAGGTAQQMQNLLQADAQRWAPLVKALELKAD